MPEIRPVSCQYAVEVMKLAAVERDQRACPQHRLVLVERRRRPAVSRQRPEEPRQTRRVADLFQSVADLSHLLRRHA